MTYRFHSIFVAIAVSACSTVLVPPPDDDDGSPTEGGEPSLEWSLGGIDAGAGPVAEPAGLVIAPDGTTFLAGRALRSTGDYLCGVERIAADGTYLGLTEYTPNVEGLQFAGGAGITLGPQGQAILLCGAVVDNALEVNAWVGWLAPDGSLLAEAVLPGVRPSAIASTQDPNEVIVIGDDRQSGHGTYVHLSREGVISGALTLENHDSYYDEDLYSAVPGIARHPEGWMAVIHSTSVNPHLNDLVRIDGVTRTSLGAACGIHVAIAPDGAIYTSGDYSAPTMRICRHTESGGAWSVQEWPVEMAGSYLVQLEDIAADELGNVVVTGNASFYTDELRDEQNMFARGYSAGGELLWSDEFGSSDKWIWAYGLVIGARADRVVYAGTLQSWGTVLRSLKP
jgi:hypothetical protein